MDEELDGTIDAPEAEAGAVAEPEARAEPEAEAAAPTPAPAEIDWNNVETLRAAAAHLQGLGYEIGPAAQPQPEEPAEYDPYDPNSVLSVIAASPFGQTLQQLQAYAVGQQQAQVNGQIGDLLSAVAEEKNLGEHNPQVFRALADSFAQTASQKYGATPQAAKYAAELAADWLAAERAASAKAAVDAYRVSIGEIAATPGEPSAAGGGIRIEAKPSTYDEIIAKYEGRIATV